VKKTLLDELAISIKLQEKRLEELRQLYASVKENDINDVSTLTDRNFFVYWKSKNAQEKAIPIQNYIINKLGLTGVPASEGHGDAKGEETYYEIKCSFLNKDNRLNIRQIRLYQNNDYYICCFVNEDDLQNSVVYLLTHQQMKKEVELNGGFTHGTKDANEDNKKPEYSLTVEPYNTASAKTQRWEQYKSNHLKELIFGKC